MIFQKATPEELDMVVDTLVKNGWSVQGKTLLPNDKRMNNAATWFTSASGVMVPHWAAQDYEAAEYAAKQKELFEDNNIPVEFQGALSHLAWEQGHAYGYNEVYIHLSDLVDALAEPIHKYGMNIKRSSI